MESFQGYDQSEHAPLPMQYLLQQYYLYPSSAGNPPFTLRSPGKDQPIAPWQYEYQTHFSRSQATTIESTPDSPSIDPKDLHMAPKIVTATYNHHWFILGDVDHDMCFAFDQYNSATGYWYVKPEPDDRSRSSKSNLKLNEMISSDQVSRLLQLQPDRWGTGAHIELWKLRGSLDPATYQLQAGYTLTGLSLVDYLAFLSLDPQIFNKDGEGRISLTE